VDIDELYQQKAEIYELYKTDRKKYHNEYYKICKKIRYWSDENFRKEKNKNDNIRITSTRVYVQNNRDLVQSSICAM
jgi:hypothetical protein